MLLEEVALAGFDHAIVPMEESSAPVVGLFGPLVAASAESVLIRKEALKIIIARRIAGNAKFFRGHSGSFFFFLSLLRREFARIRA